MSWRTRACAALLVLAGASPGTSFTVYAHTGLKLTDIVWTGRTFLYLENTTNKVWSAGTPPTLFAAMPPMREETRCRMSPGTHGFAAGYLYCHTPDNTLYRISPSGDVSAFAKLPESATSDGALAFDTTGRFGYRLVAATGRSGNVTPTGGAVYAITPTGDVTLIGRYDAPGGADELAIAPARFGSGSGDVVLGVDAGESGTLLLMDPAGATRTIARLPSGPNPIAAIPTARSRAARVRAGLYVTDTNTTDVFFAPAASLRRYAGTLLVGTETGGTFWDVRPRGGGFDTRRVALHVSGSNLNLEGAVYVG